MGIASRSVLIVEDDISTGYSLEDVLRELGFEVIYATSAAQARRSLEQRSTLPGAAIVGVALPDMFGDELAHELRALYPKLPVILASRFGREVFEKRFRGDHLMRFISKPANRDVVAGVLRGYGLCGRSPVSELWPATMSAAPVPRA